MNRARAGTTHEHWSALDRAATPMLRLRLTDLTIYDKFTSSTGFDLTLPNPGASGCPGAVTDCRKGTGQNGMPHAVDGMDAAKLLPSGTDRRP